jgi:hypothetical protein
MISEKSLFPFLSVSYAGIPGTRRNGGKYPLPDLFLLGHDAFRREGIGRGTSQLVDLFHHALP